MHCNSAYPADDKDLNLRTLITLKNHFNCKVGYCLDPDTKILTTDLNWIKAKDISIGTEIIAFPESLNRDNKYCTAKITDKDKFIKPRFRIKTERGEVICSDTHKFPVYRWQPRKRKNCVREGDWKRYWIMAKDLKIGDRLTQLVEPWEVLTSRESGYIAGLLDGEGWVSERHVGFCQNPGVVFDFYENFIRNVLKITFYTSTLPKCKAHGININGRRQSLRLLGMIRPQRLLSKAKKIWEGTQTFHQDSQTSIIEIEKLDSGEVIGLETTTGTLIANGFLSHNSCHSPGIIAPVIAVALGASSIEKHITLNRTMYGTDQASSVEIHGLQRMISYIRDVEKQLGDGIKSITETEQKCRTKLWKVEDEK
jgi:hypothetical protein